MLAPTAIWANTFKPQPPDQIGNSSSNKERRPGRKSGASLLHRNEIVARATGFVCPIRPLFVSPTQFK